MFCPDRSSLEKIFCKITRFSSVVRVGQRASSAATAGAGDGGAGDGDDGDGDDGDDDAGDDDADDGGVPWGVAAMDRARVVRSSRHRITSVSTTTSGSTRPVIPSSTTTGIVPIKITMTNHEAEVECPPSITSVFVRRSISYKHRLYIYLPAVLEAVVEAH